MTVRKEVAKREAAPAEPKVSLVQIAEDTLSAHAAMLDAILPPEVERRRFAQMTIQAVRSAPELMRCFRTKQGAASFLLAAGQAAMVGLEPNTPLQECWILPRKAKNVQEAQMIIGYRGILKLARRSPGHKAVVAEVVHENDEFDYGYGDDGPWLTWKPAKGDPGELTHAFCISWTLTGGRAQTVLNRVQVEARRAKSESWTSRTGRPYSPWTLWPESMWRKSAIRAHSPFLDLTVEAATVLERDEQRLTFDPATGAIETSEVWGALEAGSEEDGSDGPDSPVEVRGEDRGASTHGEGSQADTAAAGPPTDDSGREYAPDDPERPM